ncbi:MAG: hypothetical protein R3F10_10235 [Lysobacteraceae bacterium]
MNHRALKARVAAAERRVDAHLSAAVRNLDHVGVTTRASATPLRIVVAGLLGGFLIGKLRPLRGAQRVPGLFRAAAALVPMLDAFGPLMAGLRAAAQRDK